MISNSIDGSSSNQVLDLLSILSGSPEVYANKLKALQEATAEHKKFVESVGPAGDIVGLKNKALQDSEAAKKELDAAKAEAKDLVSKAKGTAKSLLDSAEAKSAEILSAAELKIADANKLMNDASKKNEDAVKAQAKADSDIQAAKNKAAELEKAIDSAKAAKAELESAKAELIAKHKAFIESL